MVDKPSLLLAACLEVDLREQPSRIAPTAAAGGSVDDQLRDAASAFATAAAPVRAPAAATAATGAASFAIRAGVEHARAEGRPRFADEAVATKDDMHRLAILIEACHLLGQPMQT